MNNHECVPKFNETHNLLFEKKHCVNDIKIYDSNNNYKSIICKCGCLNSKYFPSTSSDKI